MRIIGWAAALVFVLALALVGLALTVSPEALARRLGARVAEATGGEVAITGPVGLDLWPRPVLRAEDVAVVRGDRPILMARRIVAPLGLGTLAGGLPDRVEAEGAVLRLDPGALSLAGGLPALSLRDSEVVIERPGGTLTLGAVDLDAAMSGGALRLAGSALLNGRAVAGEAVLPDAAALLSGELAELEAELRLARSTLTLEGRADLDPPSFEGRATLASTDALAGASAVDLAPPRLPEGFGARRIEASAALTLAPGGGLHLRDMVATLDGNRVSGAVDVAQGAARPRVTARLAAEALDLSAFGPDANGGETWLVSETGWSRDPIPAAALGVLDLDLTLSAGPVAMGALTLDALEAGLAIDAGRAVLTLAPARVAGGEIAGRVVLNGRDGVSARADLELSGIDAAALSRGLSGVAPFEGRVSGRVDLLGTGGTMVALMSGAGGEIAARLSEGRIAGADLASLAQGGPAGGATPLTAATATLRVADGVARGDDLSLRGPGLAATGSGRLDLAAQLIDWRLAVESGGAPIRVTGPWADPDLARDREAIARAEAEARAAREAEARAEEERAAAAREAAEAERRAREAAPPPAADPLAPVRERAARELGVEPEVLTDRDAVEDAIRRRVEREIIDLLQNR